MKSDKTKILFAITKSNFGGAQKYVYDLASGLDKNLFDIVVVLGGDGLLKEKLEERNIKIIGIDSLTRDVNVLKDFISGYKLIKIIFKEKPDILHLNSSKISGIGAFIGRIFGVKKIIFTAHGFAFNEDRTFLSKIIIRFLVWLTIVLSHKTIMVSEKTKSQAPTFLIPKEKIVVIHNGIKPENLLSKEEAILRLGIKDKIEKDTKIIITIAELHKSKGLEYSIEAVKKLRDYGKKIKYLILGEGGERQNLEKLIEKLNLENLVILKGFVKDASKYLLAGDIFLLNSNTEAFSLSILEAGFAKLPVVASDVGGIPEIIESGKTGVLVKPKDIEGIKNGILFFMENPEKTKEISENLFQKVSKYFTLEKTIEKTKNIYTEN